MSDEIKGGEVVDENGEVVADAPQVASVIVEAPEVVAAVDGEVVYPEPAPEVADPLTPVEMVNPSLAGGETAQTTQAAFDETWRALGWRRVVGRTGDGGLVLAPEIDAIYPEGDGSGSDAERSTGSTDEDAPAPEPEASAGSGSDSDAAKASTPKAKPRA